MSSNDNASSSPGTHREPVQLDAKALASARRDALLRRARRIRRSVASLTAVLFSTAFLVIYVQLASGHDPALVANAKRTAGTSTTTGSSKASTTSTSTESSTGEDSEPTDTESPTSSATESEASEESSGGASAVTTSQS
ncbi:MAG TPA: hypothetical protein VIH71_12210 [Solirubrobacteraceae bacterium]